MLVEGASFILALGALIVPGWFFCTKMGLLSRQGSLGLVFLFSMAMVGAAQYGMSFFLPHPNAYLFITLFVSIIGTLLLKKGGKSPWKNSSFLSSPPPFHDSIVQVGVGILVLIFAFLILQYPSSSFDDLSYHLPFIEAFAERGEIAPIQAPMNEYEHRINSYPKFFEAMVGSLNSLSPLVASLIPVVILITFALLVYFISSHFGKPSVIGALLVGTSIIVLPVWFSFFVEGFMGVLLLGMVALLLEKKISWMGIGILIGAFIATKLTAPLYIISLVLVLATFYRTEIGRQWFLFASAIVASGGYEVRRWASALYEQFSSKVDQLLTTGIVSEWGSGGTMHMLFWVLFQHIRDPIMIALGITGVSIFLLSRRKMDKFELRKWTTILGICGLPIIGYFFMTIVLQTTYFGSFFRYLIPAFMVGSLIPSIEWSRLMAFFENHHGRLTTGATLLLVGICLAPALISLSNYSEKRMSGNLPLDIAMNALQETPPGSTIFFANAPNPLIYGLDHMTIRDQTSFRTLEDPPCESLRKKGVTHLFVFYSESNRPELGKVNDAIVRAAREGECGTLQSEMKNFFKKYDLGQINNEK